MAASASCRGDGGLTLLRHPIVKQDEGDALAVEVGSPIKALMTLCPEVVTATRADNDSPTGGSVGRWQTDGQGRMLQPELTLCRDRQGQHAAKK